MEPVSVIGAGLAGCECAVHLGMEGKTVHHSPNFAELVCSNSLRSDQPENAVGLLKEEMRRLHSLILSCADEHRVEAGGALAVDREGFSAAVTEKVRSHPLITVAEGEVTEIPEGEVVIAAGPLASDSLTAAIAKAFPDSGTLNFFDAAAHRHGSGLVCLPV